MMEFARKITIGRDIPPTEKYIPSVKETPPSKKRQLSFKQTFQPKTLDGEIKRILRLKLDDRRKWILYQEVLHEFLDKPKKDVLEHVKYKERAHKLLDTLNGIVEWTHDGTVSVHGKEIPHSHIAELVESYFEPSRPRPVGWETFKTVLPIKDTVEKSVQWEDWPPKKSPLPKRSPIPRLVKHGKRT